MLKVPENFNKFSEYWYDTVISFLPIKQREETYFFTPFSKYSVSSLSNVFRVMLQPYHAD